MLRRETGRDDRGRDERGRGRDRERLREVLSIAAALLAAVLLDAGREDDANREGTAGERTALTDAATSLRDRVIPGGSGTGGTGAAATGETEPAATDGTGTETTGGTGVADAEGTTGLPRTVRTVASDRRLRRGAPVAAALLAGLLLAGRRDGEASTEETSNRRGDVIDAVTRIRSRAAADATDRAGTERAEDGGATERAEDDGATDRPGSTGNDTTDAEGTVTTDAAGTATGDSADVEGRPDDTVATGIDADVDDLWAPTTGGMPMLGVGTYRRADYDECLDSVRQALQVGYRHIDTTDRREAYYAEEAVGDAVARSGVDREDVFVATKVTPADLDRDHVRTSAEESLDRLGMEYVDLLYVHWPTHDYEPAETLDAFAQLREDGLVDRIGVSNFTVDLLEEALDVADAPIFANQVEMHPLLPQEDLREFCERAGVEVVAFSPIARGDVEDVTELQAVAAKHGATPEQVSLAWLREKGVAAIPRATSEDHLRENWRSLALELDDEDVSRLDAIEERRRIVDPDEAPWNQ